MNKICLPRNIISYLVLHFYLFLQGVSCLPTFRTPAAAPSSRLSSWTASDQGSNR